MNRTSVYKIGKHRNATKTGRGVQKYTSPIPSCHGGKPEDTAHHLLEEVSSQMGTSLKTPFRFMQSSRSPSINSLSPEDRRACWMTPENCMFYCSHVRVTLGEGGNCPPPSHAWSGLLIADVFHDDHQEWITEAVVLAQGRPSCSLEEDGAKKGSPIQVQEM